MRFLSRPSLSKVGPIFSDLKSIISVTHDVIFYSLATVLWLDPMFQSPVMDIFIALIAKISS